MATIDTVKDVLVENLDLEADKITEEATLESLGIDSLDMVELICDLEEKCDVEFGEPEGIETVGQLSRTSTRCKGRVDRAPSRGPLA